MIYSLQDVVHKILRSRKGLLISTLVSLTIGVTIILSLIALSIQSEDIMRSEIQKQYGNMDLYVELDHPYPEAYVDELYTYINTHGNVREASICYIGFSEIDGHISAYTVLADNSALSKSRYKFVADLKASECMLNRSLAQALHVEIGDVINVENGAYTVIEILEDVAVAASMPDIIIMHQNDALSKQFKPYILVDVAEIEDALSLTESIKSFNPSLLINVLYDDTEIHKVIESTRSFLGLLAVISIVMCASIITANLQLFIFSFSKQLGLLRTIGMSRNQAFQFLMRIGTTLNGIGVGLALAVYLSLHFIIDRVLGQFVFNKSVAQPLLWQQSILVAFICFMVLECVVLVAALKLSDKSALAAKRKNEKMQISRKGLYLGIAFYLAAFVLYARNIHLILTPGTDTVISNQVAVASILLFIFGSLILLGQFLDLAFRMLLFFSERFRAFVLTMGLKLIRPQMKRNVTIVRALTIIFMILVISGSLYDTIQNNSNQYLEKQFMFDLVISDRATDTLIDASMINQIEQESSVNQVVVWGENASLLNITDDSWYLDFNYVSFDTLREIGMIKGQDYDPSSDIMMYETLAGEMGYSVGDTLKLSTNYASDLTNDDVNVDYHTFTIYEIIPGDGRGLLLDWSYDYFEGMGRDIQSIHVDSNAIDKTTAFLESNKAQYPTMKWQTRADAIEESNRMLAARMRTIIVIMGLIFLLVNVASFNMLISTITSKKKEFAILRAIDLNQNAFIRLIILIPVVYQMLAAVFGVTMGIISLNMFSMIDNQSFAHINALFPVIALGIILFASALIFYWISRRYYGEKVCEVLKVEF